MRRVHDVDSGDTVGIGEPSAHPRSHRIRVALALPVLALVMTSTACGSHLPAGVPSQSAWASAPKASGSLSLRPGDPNQPVPTFSALTQFCSDVAANQTVLVTFPTTSQRAAEIATIWDTITRESPAAIQATAQRLAKVIHAVADGRVSDIPDAAVIGADLTAFGDWVHDNCGGAPITARPS